MTYNRQRTFDDELTLIKKTITYDEIGNPVTVESKTDVFCNVESIGRHEYYSANQQGLKPSKVFVIHSYEYDGETTVEHDETVYTVMKTYQVDFEELELTCERKTGNV